MLNSKKKKKHTPLKTYIDFYFELCVAKEDRCPEVYTE